MPQQNDHPDFQTMQQQAIRRVREMQEKAMPAGVPPPEEPSAPKQQQPQNRPRTPLFHLDSDVSLLLPLLLLLSREGADDALLLALLYIMA